jgi:hypothetical protein
MFGAFNHGRGMAKGKHEVKWNEKQSWHEMNEKIESMKNWGWTRSFTSSCMCPPPTKIATQ